MPSIESLIAPGGLIREIGLAWKPPAGMGCNVLTTLLGMATAGKIPQEALDGSVALWPWRRLLGSEAWTESMVPVGQPWAHLYAMQRLVGGEITIQATTATPCLIPGSMYDGAAILFPEKGAAKSFYTVNHGAGRASKFHGRKDAIRKLTHHQDRIDQEMQDVTRVFAGVEIKGIATNNEHVPLDESREAYKSLDEVLRALSETKIAKVSRRLYPVANIKESN